MGGGLESVDRGLSEEWVGHQAEPLDRGSVRGHHRGRSPMPLDDQFVDVGGVERVERLEREVVDHEEVDAQEFADFGVVAVVEPRGAESFEEPVAAFEVDTVAAADCGVSERCRQKVLPTPTGPRTSAL